MSLPPPVPSVLFPSSSPSQSFPQAPALILQRFVKEKGLQTCSLSDGKTTVVFHLNPTTFSYETEDLYYEAPAYAGLVRWEYGVKPFPLTIEGTTGNAGLQAAAGGLYDLEKFRPQWGKPNPLLTFAYPARFKGSIHVRMNKMSDNISPDKNLYNQYQMSFSVYPAASTIPAERLASSPLTVTLPVGG